MKWYEYALGVGALAGAMAGWVYLNKPVSNEEPVKSDVKLQGFSVDQNEIRAKYLLEGKHYLIVDKNKDGSIDEFFADEKPAPVTAKHQSIYDKMLKENIITK